MNKHLIINKKNMTDRRNKKLYIDNPIIVLNGLVTDKNKYSRGQKIEFLKKKKKLNEKQSKNVSSPLKNRKNGTNNNNREKINNNIIMLSEDSDSNEIPKMKNKKNNVKSPQKDNKNKKIKKIKNISTDEEEKENAFSPMSEVKKRKNALGDYKLKKNQYNNKRKISNLIEDDEEYEIEDDNDEILTNHKNKNKIRDVFPFKSSLMRNESVPNINYKNVEENINYDYKEIRNKCKNNSCIYISLFNYNELKSIIESYSAVLQFFKKIKKEEKENIIISDQDQEKNLINALNEFLNHNRNNKYELFQKLKPEYNNILNYIPGDYCGINSFGFMNICSYNGEDKIKFITPFFKDKTNKYILKFRKYILNLSSFKSNNDDENSIYHIIIPKNSLKKIDINFNEEMNINDLLNKLNCEYYFFNQKPGELLIVEPGSLHLSYYKKSENTDKQDKNYLLMFWNKMSIDSFFDYMTLKNDCLNEGYKHFPILSMLFNLINKKIKNLSDDSIKTIREIYNEMDSYENINKYIKEINDNNISFHKLFLNNIDLCSICQQEIFNFYVYNNDKNEENDEKNNNNNFLCINCAYKKKYFSIPKSIIFFKYSKDELESFVNKIFTYINKNKNDINNNINDYKDKDIIISKYFDLNNRKDDCINIDEFILKLDGPLKIIDKEYENNNFLSNKNIKVDKYLKFLENDKLNNPNFTDPLNKINFINNTTNDDIYEIFKPKDYPNNYNNNNIVSIIDNVNPNINMNNNIYMNNKNEIINLNDNEVEKNQINNNDDTTNSFSLFKNRERDNIFEQGINNNDIINPFINRENKDNNQIKKKKKKGSTVSDLIAGGMF